MNKTAIILTISSLLTISCGHSARNPENSVNPDNTTALNPTADEDGIVQSESKFNPRDTVVVPDHLTGEDSIAYIEDAVLKSPLCAKDLLELAEVHTIESMLYKYNNLEMAKENPEYASEYVATRRDSAAMRLANRFIRMKALVEKNGDATDKLQWAVAVNYLLDSLRQSMPSIPSDSALYEIERVMDKFSSLTQHEMNYQSYVLSSMEDYLTFESYRQWLSDVPANLKTLAMEEFKSWHDLNEARFAFWNDVSYTQDWYSMKPMEINAYSGNLSCNRRAELEIERSVIMGNKVYRQKGTTVTTRQWEDWIAEHSVPEDVEFLRETDREYLIPSDSLVTERINALMTSFSRWLASRQAFAAALPKEQGTSYDYITADIHCRLIGKLASLIPYELRMAHKNA